MPNSEDDGDWGFALFFDRKDGKVETTLIDVAYGRNIELKTMMQELPDDFDTLTRG